MLDISKAFGIPSQKIASFFQQPGVGLYIPLYQRPYSWDGENVEQLMEDIRRGVYTLLGRDKESAIRFLGTVILVTETDRNQIQPQDKTALPTRIDKVIDGQQRISTIALLACMLYQNIATLRTKIPGDATFDGLREATDSYLGVLRDVFSVDLGRGTPARKPIIIRGSQDAWTLNGPDDYYKSAVAAFLASFIRSISTPTTPFPSIPRQTLVGKNLKQMQDILAEVVNAHITPADDFPPAWDILAQMSQDELWLYERQELVGIVDQAKQYGSAMTNEQNLTCSLVQLFAFSYYLLQRCCFTVIEPVRDIWAFDMFQSLNATGTPLTSIETFKPLVINKAEHDPNGFKGSASDDALKQVDKLFEPLRSAASKDRLTNEYLTMLAVAHDGTKMTNTFSEQRRWLMDEFEKCTTQAEREEFVQRMANLATYWSQIGDFKNKDESNIPGAGTICVQARQAAAISLLYLQDSSHKMANSILSRFYSSVLRGNQGAEQAFIEACKAIAAFYTLWRAASSNAGLDDVYRRQLREYFGWEARTPTLSIQKLKQELKQELKDRGFSSQSDWVGEAITQLRYDNVQKVCRFALLVAAHDTMPDPEQPGLMTPTIHAGYATYLTPQQWKSPDLQSIEHIAPQQPKQGWDAALYTNEAYHLIGNLTLLPIAINSAIGNKGWVEKRAYYQHLAVMNQADLVQLAQEEAVLGLQLTQDTLDKLHQANHAHHIKPIIALDNTGVWDKQLVEARTKRICEIVWNRLYNQWLN